MRGVGLFIQSNNTAVDSELDQFGTGVQAKLCHDMGTVGLYCAGAKDQLFGNFLVSTTFGDKFQDLLFPICQPIITLFVFTCTNSLVTKSTFKLSSAVAVPGSG